MLEPSSIIMILVNGEFKIKRSRDQGPLTQVGSSMLGHSLIFMIWVSWELLHQGPLTQEGSSMLKHSSIFIIYVSWELLDQGPITHGGVQC
jgi:hypothetical protein